MLQRTHSDHAVLTVEEAAGLMKVSRNYLYLLIKSRKGPPIKRLGNRIRIPLIGFNTWLNTPSKGK